MVLLVYWFYRGRDKGSFFFVGSFWVVSVSFFGRKRVFGGGMSE